MTKELNDEFPHEWGYWGKVYCCQHCGKKPNRFNYDRECDQRRKESA
jgi:hypothetical protein